MSNREAVQAQLKVIGIPTAVHYPLPLHCQPAVIDVNVHLPHSEKATVEVISLPMHPYLPNTDIKRIVEALIAAHPVAASCTNVVKTEW